MATENPWLADACCACFDSLLDSLFPSANATICLDSIPRDSCPLFVTWNKVNSRGGESLRGCIGTLSPVSLHSGLQKYSCQSAFHDRRFDPISVREVPSLRCSVNILFKFESARDYRDWEVGKHGTTIEFVDKTGRHYSATYLPFVAPEQGWDHQQTIDSLVKKSGYDGIVDEKLRKSLKVTRYQGCKTGVAFDEYKSIRKLQGRWPFPI